MKNLLKEILHIIVLWELITFVGSLENQTVHNYIVDRAKFVENNTNKFVLNDIEFEQNFTPFSIKLNLSDTKIIKNVDNYIFLLSTNQLYAVNMSIDQKINSYYVGELTQLDGLSENVVIEIWKNVLIVVVSSVRTQKLLIYVVDLNFQQNIKIDPIGKIELSSHLSALKLIKKPEDLYMTVLMSDGESSKQLNLFKWKNLFFSLVDKSQFELPDNCKIVSFEKPSIFLVIGEGTPHLTNVTVQVFTIQESVHKLKKLQKRRFLPGLFLSYEFNEKLYLKGCSLESQCGTYKWTENQFVRDRKLKKQFFENIQKVYDKYNVIIVQSPSQELKFYLSGDVENRPPSFQMNLPTSNFTDYSLFVSNPAAQLYFVQYQQVQENFINVNFHKINFKKTEEKIVGSGKTMNSRLCVEQLKIDLKERLKIVDSMKERAVTIKSIATKPSFQNKKIIHAKYANIKKSRFNKFKIPINIHKSADQLLNGTVNSNIKIELTRQEFERAKLKSLVDVDGGLSQVRDNSETENQIVTTNLIYSGKQNIFNGMLKKSDPKDFAGSLVLEKLVAKKLNIAEEKINNIGLSELTFANKLGPDHKIQGQKIFQKLNVDRIEIRELLNEVNFKEFLNSFHVFGDDKYIFETGINITNLVVEQINGISWQKFQDDLYIKSNSTTLNGNLIFTNPSKVNFLNVEFLQMIPVTSYMTTSTEQKILSDVFIDNFFAENMKTKLVNDENFAENVALINQENFIETPTKFFVIHINKNLTIDENDENHEKTFDMLKRHIIGTRVEDLMQIYNNEVRIQGSLILQNVILDGSKAGDGIFLNDRKISSNISNAYWMKNLDQEILIPLVKFNDPVEANQVVTKNLQSHPTANHLLLDTNEPQGYVHLMIANGDVENNVVNQNSSIPSLVSNLANVAVTRKGGFKIQSPIIFAGKLTVKNLISKRINQNLLSNLATVNQSPMKFTGSVSIRNLEVDSILDVQQLEILNYNQISLSNFISNAVKIHEPFQIDTLKIENVDCSNLTVNKFEVYNFEELYRRLENEFDNPDTSKGKTVNIFGNVNFFSNLEAEKINDADVDLHLVVLNSNEKVMIGGTKTFKSDVNLEQNLNVKYVNNFELNYFFTNVLQRKAEQFVVAPWTFKNLKSNIFKSRQINHRKNIYLVDRKANKQVAASIQIEDLSVANLNVKNCEMNSQQILQILRNPVRSDWENITVMGDTFMAIASSSILDELLSNGVCTHCPAQFIKGKVIFQGQQIVFDSIFKSDDIVFYSASEFADLKILNADSLKRSSIEPQIFTSKKLFVNYIYFIDIIMDELGGFLNVSVINNINIVELNQAIFRFSQKDVLRLGIKYFRNPVFINDLIVHEMINGVSPNSMIFATSNGIHLPSLKIENLIVKEVSAEKINGIVLEHFLKSRMRKSGVAQNVTEHLTFEWLELQDDSTITSINNVHIKDVVYSKSYKAQDIQGHKQVLGNIKLIGPSAVNYINNHDLLDSFKEIVRYDQNHYINYLELPGVELENGLEITKSINNRYINDVIYSDQRTPSLSKLLPLIPHIESTIEALQLKTQHAPERFLYIDYNPSVHIIPKDNEILDTCSSTEIQLNPQPDRVYMKLVNKRNLNFSPPLSINMTISTSVYDSSCSDNQIDEKTKFMMLNWENNGQKFFQNFTFPNYISDLKVMEPPNCNSIFLVMVFENLDHISSTLAILELDKTTNEWSENLKISSFQEYTKTAVVHTREHSFLIVSSFQKSIQNHQERVHIYHYQHNTNKFIEVALVPEKLDIILGINVHKLNIIKQLEMDFLIMAKTDGRKLLIYKLKPGKVPKFSLYSRILYDAGIADVVVVTVIDNPYFIVSLRDGNFFIYRWRGIFEGWRQEQNGYFHDINHIKSYEYLKNQYLFLLSAQKKATALSIYKQGRKF